MPCQEFFDQQDEQYKEAVLPNAMRKRLSVEMASSFGWHKYVGLDGITMSIDEFGKVLQHKMLSNLMDLLLMES